MESSQQESIESIREAISLNNRAVELVLERRSFSQAIPSLRSAISLLRNDVFPSNETTASNIKHESRSRLNSQREKHLDKAEDSCDEYVALSTWTYLSEGSFSMSTEPTRGHSKLSMVRIDESFDGEAKTWGDAGLSGRQENTCHQWAFLAGILMYNLGVCFLGMARYGSVPRTTKQRTRTAHHLFQKAYAILIKAVKSGTCLESKDHACSGLIQLRRLLINSLTTSASQIQSVAESSSWNRPSRHQGSGSLTFEQWLQKGLPQSATAPSA